MDGPEGRPLLLLAAGRRGPGGAAGLRPRLALGPGLRGRRAAAGAAAAARALADEGARAGGGGALGRARRADDADRPAHARRGGARGRRHRSRRDRERRCRWRRSRPGGSRRPWEAPEMGLYRLTDGDERRSSRSAPLRRASSRRPSPRATCSQPAVESTQRGHPADRGRACRTCATSARAARPRGAAGSGSPRARPTSRPTSGLAAAAGLGVPAAGRAPRAGRLGAGGAALGGCCSSRMSRGTEANSRAAGRRRHQRRQGQHDRPGQPGQRGQGEVHGAQAPAEVERGPDVELGRPHGPGHGRGIARVRRDRAHRDRGSSRRPGWPRRT